MAITGHFSLKTLRQIPNLLNPFFSEQGFSRSTLLPCDGRAAKFYFTISVFLHLKSSILAKKKNQYFHRNLKYNGARVGEGTFCIFNM